MPDALSQHPTDQTLRSFSRNTLDRREADTVREHLGSCRACLVRVATLTEELARQRPAKLLERPDSAPPAGSSLDLEVKLPANADSEPALEPETLPPGLAEHRDYRIVRELGRGGMGVVYLAENLLLGRHEVLKVMGRNIIEKPGVLDRFLREIRSVAQLRHPNIVAGYSAFRLPDSIVFAMEYVEGYDLSKLVKARGALSIAHAANFAYQAAQGLQHAHEAGMVHRDIKPGNLMLSRQGGRALIKVLDFGLAKATREQPLERNLTHEGQMLGTPDYIAPEQTLDAQSADIRADIYSLGCTLYYLLKGGPPFHASSLFEILQAHQSKEPEPLDRVRADVPVELTRVLARMMAKRPEDRFLNPAEAAQALRPFFKGTGTSPVRSVASPAVTPPAPPPSDSCLPAGQIATASPASHGPQTAPGRAVIASGPGTVPNIALVDEIHDTAESSMPWKSVPVWTWPGVGAVLLLIAGLFFLIPARSAQKPTAGRSEQAGQAHEGPAASSPVLTDLPRRDHPGPAPAPSDARGQAAAPPARTTEPAHAAIPSPDKLALAENASATAASGTESRSPSLPGAPPRISHDTPDLRPASLPIVPPPPPRPFPADATARLKLPPALGDRATPHDLLRHAERVLMQMKYMKQPQKDRIRVHVVGDLGALLRNPNRKGGLSAQMHEVERIKQEVETLEDSSLNPANLSKLKEATTALECAVTMVKEGIKVILREPAARTGQPAVSGLPHRDASSWRVNLLPVSFRLTAEDDERPPGSFWPELSLTRTEGWLVGDPASIRQTSKGVILEAGRAGNLLLTRKSDYTKCLISIRLAAFADSEAYLALRAGRGPEGWHAVTSRIVGQDGDVRSGFCSFDFETRERGHQAAEKPAGKTFAIRFEIDDKDSARVFVNGQQTSTVLHLGGPVPEYVGSVGLFVRTGKLQIESVEVADR